MLCCLCDVLFKPCLLQSDLVLTGYHKNRFDVSIRHVCQHGSCKHQLLHDPGAMQLLHIPFHLPSPVLSINGLLTDVSLPGQFG